MKFPWGSFIYGSLQPVGGAVLGISRVESMVCCWLFGGFGVGVCVLDFKFGVVWER